MEIGGAQFGALRRLDHAAVADESHPFGAPKRAAALLSCEENVLTSDVLPANSSIDDGRPSTSHRRPITIWRLPDLRSRL